MEGIHGSGMRGGGCGGFGVPEMTHACQGALAPSTGRLGRPDLLCTRPPAGAGRTLFWRVLQLMPASYSTSDGMFYPGARPSLEGTWQEPS